MYNTVFSTPETNPDGIYPVCGEDCDKFIGYDKFTCFSSCEVKEGIAQYCIQGVVNPPCFTPKKKK